jgi:hypothetical protein
MRVVRSVPAPLRRSTSGRAREHRPRVGANQRRRLTGYLINASRMARIITLSGVLVDIFRSCLALSVSHQDLSPTAALEVLWHRGATATGSAE